MVTPMEHLEDETLLNVVDFFKSDSMGRVRRYSLDVAVLPLSDDLVAHDVHAEFRLSRVGTGLLAEGVVEASVELTCVRTLEPYPEQVEAEFAEQFYPTVDISTGRSVAPPRTDEEDDAAESDIFPISENHELDMTEPLRQVIVVALPMQPVKPGTAPITYDETEAVPADARPNPFAVLAPLLQDGEE